MNSKYGIINGDEGDDNIANYGGLGIINGDEGNDTIENTGYEVSISGGKDDDVIKNRGRSAKINGGRGNDYIFNGGDLDYARGWIDVIYGDSGDDTIINADYGIVRIIAGLGNDLVSLGGARGAYESVSVLYH